MAQDKEVTANRTYKSSVFTMVFQEKKELLELYNAVSGKHYEDPEELEINTLDNAIYMSIKNDLSFIIDSRLTLYEHQSTYNPNLPLRCLFYVADIYSKIALHKDIYGSTPLSIPDPQFVIFYNGEQEVPEREIMRLSSLYTVKEERPKLELEAVMLNIRPGHNQRLMEASRTLREYAEFVERVRKYAKTMVLEEAVERAVTECIAEGILRDFLEKNRAEVIKVCLYEYNQEEHMKFVREEGFRQGHEQGIEQGQKEGQEFAHLTNIRNLMKNMDWSVVEAMKAIGIPNEKWQEYEKKLNESQE